MPEPFLERAIEKVLERSLSDHDARSAIHGLYPVIRRRRVESLPPLTRYEVSEFLRAFARALPFRRPARASALSWRIQRDRQRPRCNPSWDQVSGPPAR